MTNKAWRFLEVRPEAVSQDPTQREFFAPEEGAAGALVREALQNSLDARPTGASDPAIVRFHFGDDPTHLFGTSEYFDVLREHLQTEFSTLPDPNGPVSFLVIEDFGTRGLQGDPEHTIYQEHDASRENRNDFFYFWRNVGRSRKEATDRGRWGLGKTVFPASSEISSFFGLTVRKSDNRKLLMGQSVLKIHQITTGEHKKIFEPYGFFGRYAETSDLALPIEDASILDEFATRFKLQRTTQSGLSIVIPFPLDELNPKSLAQEVIRSYYTSLLSGELRVIVGNPTESYDIHRDSVVATTLELPWEGYRMKPTEVAERVRFAAKSLDFDSSALVLLADQHPTKAPDSLKDRIAEDDVQELQARFEAGELLGFRIPVLVKKAAASVPSHFNAFLQRDQSLSSGTAEFVREGLTITQTGKSPRHPVRALVLVRDKPLSTLLGDAENPAHTKWQELSDKIKEGKYQHGSRTVRLVNNSIQQLTERLTFRPEQRDLNLLSEIFFIPRETEEEKGKKDGLREKEGGGTVPPGEPPTGTPRPVILAQVTGGFRLSANPASDEYPELVQVEVAYAVRSGNPFKRYRTFDFDLKSMPVKGKGISIAHASENRMSLDITDKDFVALVTGFDVNRDLEVKVISRAREVNE